MPVGKSKNKGPKYLVLNRWVSKFHSLEDINLMSITLNRNDYHFLFWEQTDSMVKAGEGKKKTRTKVATCQIPVTGKPWSHREFPKRDVNVLLGALKNS